MREEPRGFGSGHKFARKGNEDHRNHQITMDKHHELHQQDWRNVVLCNMHPFSIQQNFGDAGLVVVKGCPQGQPYLAHTIDMYRISKRDDGGGKWEPVAILPVQIAQELERKYKLQGGVFWYYADEKVPVAKMKLAGEKQLEHYRKLVRRGQDEWARYHSMARIGDNQRAAARYLASISELSIHTLEWVDKKGKLLICEQCGEDYKPGAKVCSNCEFPINVEWVRKFRKDLVAKYGLGEAPAGPEPNEGGLSLGPAPKNVDDFLNEDIDQQKEDAGLLGGN